MPERPPLYSGAISTDLEHIYYDWTALIEELRRLRGRIDSISFQIEALSIGNLFEGHGPPTNVPLLPVPGRKDRVAMYRNLDDGVIFGWSVEAQQWDI